MITVDDILNRMQWSAERDAIRSPWQPAPTPANGFVVGHATIGQTPITAAVMRELIGTILLAINNELASVIAMRDHVLDIKDPEILEAAGVALITEYQKRTANES